MNYSSKRKCDIADGPGVRVSLYVSGCTHRCKGCFNESTWDFNAGEPFTCEVEKELIEAGKASYVSGLTLLGGEPFEPQNQERLVSFLRAWRAANPGKDVWCYTGCVLEKDLLSESRWRTSLTDEMLSLIDVLVDGPFVESLKDISLRFRGSSNQRILDISGGAANARPWEG